MSCVSLSCRSSAWLENQLVFEVGHVGTDFFILLRGELKVSEKNPDSPDGLRILGYLSEGAFFGEVPLLSNYTPGSEIRTRTIESVTESSLCYISRDTISYLRQKYPELDGRLRRFSMVGGRLTAPKKGSLGLSDAAIRIHQRQTQQMVRAKQEGGIALQVGRGHRPTRYIYNQINDWSTHEPTRSTREPTARKPMPPATGSPATARQKTLPQMRSAAVGADSAKAGGAGGAAAAASDEASCNQAGETATGGWFEGTANMLEKVTGIDLDGDGDVGTEGDTNQRLETAFEEHHAKATSAAEAKAKAAKQAEAHEVSGPAMSASKLAELRDTIERAMEHNDEGDLGAGGQEPVRAVSIWIQSTVGRRALVWREIFP